LAWPESKLQMKKLTLQETHATYKISLDEAVLSNEVVILEKEGQPVAALVPMAEYAAFQAWREAERERQLEIQPSFTERQQQLAAAAKVLLPDYTTGDELTVFTVLDGEDFRE
jgi:antitoxin (DNA-binding transcriptional repressor) of toxin-antitoxin stability system